MIIKKRIIVVLALIMSLAVVFATGCGDTSEEGADETESAIEEKEESKSEPAADLKKVVYSWTDDNGYSFKATIRFSPWIHYDNPMLEATWRTLDDSLELPEDDTSNGSWDAPSDHVVHEYNNAYYCVGDITFENKTKGWDASEGDPIGSAIDIDLTESKETDDFYEPERYPLSSFRMKAYPEWEEKISVTTDMGMFVKMTENSCGPYPFVMAHFDKVTPKEPKGDGYDDLKKYAFLIDGSGNNSEYKYVPRPKIIEADDSESDE